MESTGQLEDLLHQSESQLSSLKGKIARELELAEQHSLSKEHAIRDGDEALELARRCLAEGDVEGAKAARLCASLSYTHASFPCSAKAELDRLDAGIRNASEKARKGAAAHAGETAMRRARECLADGDIVGAKAARLSASREFALAGTWEEMRKDLVGLESDIQGAVKRESLVVAALAQLQREEDEAGHVGYTAEETKADTAQDGVGSHQLARVTDCLQLESSGHGAAQEGFDRATAPCSAQEVPAKDSSQEPDRMAGHPGVGSNHWDETASYTEETSLEDAFRKLDLQSYQSAAANGGAASECEPALGDGEDVVADVDAANDSHRRVPTCTRTNSTDSQCATFSAGAAAAAALHHSLLSSPLAFKDAKAHRWMSLLEASSDEGDTDRHTQTQTDRHTHTQSLVEASSEEGHTHTHTLTHTHTQRHTQSLLVASSDVEEAESARQQSPADEAERAKLQPLSFEDTTVEQQPSAGAQCSLSASPESREVKPISTAADEGRSLAARMKETGGWRAWPSMTATEMGVSGGGVDTDAGREPEKICFLLELDRDESGRWVTKVSDKDLAHLDEGKIRSMVQHLQGLARCKRKGIVSRSRPVFQLLKKPPQADEDTRNGYNGRGGWTGVPGPLAADTPRDSMRVSANSAQATYLASPLETPRRRVNPPLCTSRLLAGVEAEDEWAGRQRVLRGAAADGPVDSTEFVRSDSTAMARKKALVSRGSSSPFSRAANKHARSMMMGSFKARGSRSSISGSAHSRTTPDLQSLPLDTPRRAPPTVFEFPVPEKTRDLCTSRLLAHVEEEDAKLGRARLLRSRGSRPQKTSGGDGALVEKEEPVRTEDALQKEVEGADGWGMSASGEGFAGHGAADEAKRGEEGSLTRKEAEEDKEFDRRRADEADGQESAAKDKLWDKVLGPVRYKGPRVGIAPAWPEGLKGEQIHKSAVELGSSVRNLIDLAGDHETHYHLLENVTENGKDWRRKLDQSLKGMVTGSVFFLENIEENIHHGIETYASPAKYR